MKDMNLAGMLTGLFEYQRFAGNKKLQALIDETERRQLYNLSDDDLSMVSAAGEATVPKEPEDGHANG